MDHPETPLTPERHTTPIGIIRDAFWRHTDRTPDDSGVFDMVCESLAVTDPEGELTDRLIASLDPQEPGGLGLRGAALLSGMEQLAQTGDRVQQWGAIAFLGLLAITHDQKLESGPRKIADSPPEYDHDEYRAQTASFLARQALLRLKDTLPDVQGSFAQSFVERKTKTPTVSTVDIAIQLLDVQGLTQGEEDSAVQEVEIAPEMILGCRIGEPQETILPPLNPSAQHKLDRMQWIKGFDFSNELILGYPVFHDGEKVAVIYDLTVCNAGLRGIYDNLIDSEVASDYWSILAASVVTTATTQRNTQLPNAKIPMFAAKRNGDNHRVIRAYYASLGSVQDGARLFGLVAACRTKQNQQRVLRAITTRKVQGHTLG